MVAKTPRSARVFGSKRKIFCELTVPIHTGTQPVSQPLKPQPLIVLMASISSGRVQRHLPTRRCPRRCACLQAQVREDLLNDWPLKNRRDDRKRTAAVRAVLKIEIEHPPEQPHPLEQPHPTGPHGPMRKPGLARVRLRRLRGHGWLLWHHLRAQLGIRCQHAMLAKRGSAHFAQRNYADTKPDQVQSRAWHQCRQALHERKRRHHPVRRTVAPGSLER
jgi:hypothetical protein